MAVPSLSTPQFDSSVILQRAIAWYDRNIAPFGTGGILGSPLVVPFLVVRQSHCFFGRGPIRLLFSRPPRSPGRAWTVPVATISSCGHPALWSVEFPLRCIIVTHSIDAVVLEPLNGNRAIGADGLRLWSSCTEIDLRTDFPDTHAEGLLRAHCMRLVRPDPRRGQLGLPMTPAGGSRMRPKSLGPGLTSPLSGVMLRAPAQHLTSRNLSVTVLQRAHLRSAALAAEFRLGGA